MTKALISLQTKVRSTLHKEDGATAVEYGLMVALIAIVIIIAVAALGTEPQQPLQHRRELGLSQAGRRGLRRTPHGQGGSRVDGPPSTLPPRLQRSTQLLISCTIHPGHALPDVARTERTWP